MIGTPDSGLSGAEGRRQLAERNPHLTETDVGLDHPELAETIYLQSGE